MTAKRVFMHAALWAGVFTFWLLATRGHHPNLVIAVLATAVLVAAFALAVYVNGLFLLPRFARRGLRARYAVSLVATLIVLDLAAVLLIQLVYDRLWGPDPLRYGFWFNAASEGVLIIIHLAAAAGVVWVTKHLRRKQRAVRAG